jgi:thioesterase domain-containing protein
VLKDQFIGVDDDFFQLGASSLQAIQVLGMIHDQLAIPVSPKMFIKNPTIRRFAQAMGQSGILTESTSIIPMKTSGSRAPLFCIHSGGAHVFFYAGIAQYIDPELPVYAIQPKGIDGVNPFHDSIGNMAADYIREIRLVQPHGPYTLLGTCFSNAVVMEMAHQLEANGESVATIFIIDSAPAHTTPPPQGKKYTLLRFLNMLGQGDIKAIQKKIRNKVSARSKKRRLKQAPKSVIRQEAIVSNLNDLYAGYEWKAYHGRVVLIRSSEFQKRRDKQFHVDQWQKLAPTHLEIKAVPGKHLTLFDEPEVRGLSALISESLS